MVSLPWDSLRPAFVPLQSLTVSWCFVFQEHVQHDMCICATYSWSEVRILESGFIGSIWVCKHWDPQIHWQIMMLPIILAIDLRMFFFWGGEINISTFGTNQYFTTHDRSPHHLDMFWSWFGQASELAGDAASSGTNSRSGGLEPEQPGRPRFFIFSKLAHEQLGGRHVSEASTTYRGESSERICMSKMMEKKIWESWKVAFCAENW